MSRVVYTRSKNTKNALRMGKGNDLKELIQKYFMKRKSKCIVIFDQVIEI